MPVIQRGAFQHSVLRHAAVGLLGLLLGTFAFFVIAAGAILV